MSPARYMLRNDGFSKLCRVVNKSMTNCYFTGSGIGVAECGGDVLMWQFVFGLLRWWWSQSLLPSGLLTAGISPHRLFRWPQPRSWWRLRQSFRWWLQKSLRRWLSWLQWLVVDLEDMTEFIVHLY